jgi:hypothetical protein
MGAHLEKVCMIARELRNASLRVAANLYRAERIMQHRPAIIVFRNSFLLSRLREKAFNYQFPWRANPAVVIICRDRGHLLPPSLHYSRTHCYINADLHERGPSY